MKTATARDLRNRFAAISEWLERGETVVLTRRGVPIGRIVPEPGTSATARRRRRALFAQRFAPLPTIPDRDFSDILDENRGET